MCLAATHHPHRPLPTRIQPLKRVCAERCQFHSTLEALILQINLDYHSPTLAALPVS